jgi:cell division protein FtsW (lipid II flippase)
MYGSWLSVLAWSIGILFCLGALYSVINIYLSGYKLHRGKNETKADMYKNLLFNSAVEVLFFLLIIALIVFAIWYGIEPAYLYPAE